MPNDVEVVGGWRSQLTTEIRPWLVEFAPAEDSGDVIQDVTTTLTDLLDGSDYPDGLAEPPDFSGTTVTQVVSELEAGHNYRLVFLASMGGTKQSATVVLLTCPY